ncbi:EAL domain-containing protein [Geobacter sp. DSM 9736]|uniref:GGDEF/EAL domain-containing response regulator n=1 Tax=Geobacter sp. DSM 9736 TaxID=1277350 RepID=UPI000B5F01E7|nr:EAL domain-containing protein [Geobacter sp. DSM 9736]SNB46536.1 PAS domain S-box-containing protein/diguanylate cyclase (GGDEF) domain-containing protein [Geobacter sp. DSM 9736]
MGKKTAVVVIQEHVQRLLVSSVLEREGLGVHSCVDADDALRLLSSVDTPPDLIVTEVHMPGIDGWRLCSLLRSPVYPSCNHIPILVVSTVFSGEHVQQVAEELGADAFLPLPFKTAALRNQVRALLKGERHSATSGVLIVEDSPCVSRIISDGFATHGFRTSSATTGAEALEYLAEEVPEVAVIDYHLPDMSGEDLLLRVRELSGTMAIVVITVDDDPSLAARVIHAGADGYILKPFDPEYLIGLCEAARRSRSLMRIEERLAERTTELQKSERRYGLLFEKMLDAFAYHEIICDNEGEPFDYRFLEVNPAFERHTGLSRERIVGRTVREALPEIDQEWIRVFGAVALGGAPVHFDKYFAPLGKYFEINAYSPKHGYFAVTFDDITERKLGEREKERLAYYDPLTELPNRQMLQVRLNEALMQACRCHRSIAVLHLDLDRFRAINDTLGYGSGDSLLRRVADRLREMLQPEDTLARTGEDEFIVILMDGAARVADIEEKMQAAFVHPFSLDARCVYISASIGVAFSVEGETRGEALLRRADMALNQAKDSGRACCRHYDAGMEERSRLRLSLEQDLRGALDRGEFILHYQPVVDLGAGRITGVEALIRWQHPTLGLVSPASFIPVAEETGLIIPIGEWVLHQALRQLRELHTSGFPLLRMAVNLSGRQLRHAGFVETVARIIEQTGVEASFLELELTESSVMEEGERTIVTLNELKSMGISLAIDDFGTGYSSLSYLKRFPIDRLKIDRSFVRDLPDDPDDAAITRAIVAMACSMRLDVVGEGVETHAQLAFLRRNGCREVQGFLFSKPLNVEALREQLVRPLQMPALPGGEEVCASIQSCLQQPPEPLSALP